MRAAALVGFSGSYGKQRGLGGSSNKVDMNQQLPVTMATRGEADGWMAFLLPEVEVVLSLGGTGSSIRHLSQGQSSHYEVGP